MWNPWAADRYAHARARGHTHRRALRTLGRAVSRIIWRCWQTHTPYDSNRHTGLQQHITVTIPSQSELFHGDWVCRFWSLFIE
jgi:hypothetical protein